MSTQKVGEQTVQKGQLRELAKVFGHIRELSFIWINDEDDIEIEPIERGDVNHNYRVFSKSDPEQCVFVKHAFPFVKNAPGVTLPLERLNVEYQSMCYSHTALPKSVARPFVYCAERNMAVFEYLDGYQNLEAVVAAGNFNPQTFTDLAKTLGEFHQKTHRNTLKDGFDSLQEQIIGSSQMHDSIGDFYFNSGFTDKTSLSQLKPEHVKKSADFVADQGVRANLAQVHEYSKLQECLIHNDLHFNSVMVKDHKPKLIDFEFARVGNPARDVGMALAQLMALYYFHLLNPVNNPFHRQLAYKLRQACDNFIDVYFDHMKAHSEPEEEFRRRMSRHISGFVGVELVNRVLSTPHLPSIQSANHVTSVETEMLDCGLRVLSKHAQIDSVHKMLFIGFMDC